MKKSMKRISLLLAAVLVISAFNPWSALADSFGERLDEKSLLIGSETVLSNGVFWNAGYNDKITENYIEYFPKGDIVPVIAHGNDIYGAASFKAVASRAAMEGKYVLAGFNGDFFNMSNGVPTGITIKDGLLLSSDSMQNPSVGFYDDGGVTLGRPNLNIRIDGPSIGTGIGAIHLNKAVTVTSGLMLYTRDYSDDDTNKSTIPTYDILLSVDTDAFTLNSSTVATVESINSSINPTFIPEGRVLLSMAAATDYPGTLTKLMALIPGDKITLSISADPAWNEVAYAVGGGEWLVLSGKNVAPANKEIHPRTAIGIRADGSAVFYTVDGRQAGHSKGSTLSQLADRLIELGCVDAINMDGGGSTAIHTVYPGEKNIVTVNSPSQSTLRNCANYILLINRASPTGILENIHLYPYSLRILTGSKQKFTLKGTDKNYYPVDVTSALSYNAPKNIGFFDDENIFTVGNEVGSGKITVSAAGGAKGSADISVVDKPDRISISNEQDGKTLTEITVNAGEKVDLSASSTYKSLPLYSSDEAYTWTAEGGIGSIDERGCFTAANISSGTGTIKASKSGVSASIKVNIISEGWRLETFENSTYGFLKPSSAGISFKINSDLTKVRYGYKSGEIVYNFDEALSNELVLPSDIVLVKDPDIISFWVYGDGSGNSLNLTVATDEGLKEAKGTILDFTGWKMVIASIPKGANSIKSINISKSGAAKGIIYLDQFVAGIGYYVDQDSPKITMSIDGKTLKAVVTDDADSRISDAKINLTFDGNKIDFKYDQSTETLTADLPYQDDDMHRVLLIASDESGNLARSGMTIPAGSKALKPFIDMDNHWAQGNAVYLYNRNVVSGINKDHGLAYSPDSSITRAEFAVLMNNWIKGKGSTSEDIKLPFKDSDSIPSWALDSVKSMYAMGIIMGTGTEDGIYFNPAGSISRQEVMTIIGRTMIKGFGEADLSIFGDEGQVASWALPYVKTLVKQQVISGYDGKIWPKNPITRAEAATIITSLY